MGAGGAVGARAREISRVEAMVASGIGLASVPHRGKTSMTTIDKGRILVVEDDPAIRAGIGHQLRRAGYIPFAAATVAEARMRLSNTAVDLVILDLGLPDGSGLDLLTELRDGDVDSARIPVVVLTGRNPAEVKAPSLRGGAQVFLMKPAREAALLDAVAKLMSVSERCPDNLYDWQQSQRRGQGW
jgi:DNA-binding response OmpR family regulator